MVPALGYLRKSTKGERADGRERQEKSIGQQKTESVKLAAAGGFDIVAWFTDDGVSGWKRGAKRPDFQRMLAEAKALGAQAIICDNIDRFSRASVDEVQMDASELHAAGVRWIVTASHGTYDLGKRHDIGEILKFVVAVWSANEYSRQLGRRIALARRNAAMNGKRSGGGIPYGWVTDGKGGLKHGPANEVKIVRWLFEQFAAGYSLSSLAADPNKRGIPSPTGVKWSGRMLSGLIRRRTYRGDFEFNTRHRGQFYGIDDDGEVVEVAELDGPGKVYVQPRVYTPMVDPKLFDRANRRLAAVSTDRSRRKAS